MDGVLLPRRMAIGSANRPEGEFVMYVPVQDKAPHKQQVCIACVLGSNT